MDASLNRMKGKPIVWQDGIDILEDFKQYDKEKENREDTKE